MIILFQFLNLFFYCFTGKNIYLGQKAQSSFEDGTEIYPFSSITEFFNKISEISNGEEIDLIMKDNLFDNVLNEIKYEISGLKLKIRYKLK